MLDLKNFTSAISQIEEEKGISRDVILETVEMAIAAAYKKDYGEKGQIIKAKLDPGTGKFDIWQEKIVVNEDMIKSEAEIEEETRLRAEGKLSEAEEDEEGKEFRKVRFNEEKHIMLQDAKKIDRKAKLGETVRFEVEMHNEFGRIAAQTAKQVIIQRIREAERESVFEEYEGKVDGIVSGIVQRIEGNIIFFDLGKATGAMLAKDRMPREHYRIGQRMRLYLLALEQGPKGPQLFVSRSHPKMLSRLFELEVPEIAAGTVQIKAIAREPGSRSKIAVTSTEEDIDPIGSCVGQRGTRVTTVIQELGGEKIDIIEWKEDAEEFIAHSLSPAKILDVKTSKGRAQVVVAEDQLSLAIGKDGQNVRLAAKLTGWKIDIVSKETGEVAESSEESEEFVQSSEGIEEDSAEHSETGLPQSEGLGGDKPETKKKTAKKEEKEK
jgi:N utilization substance protein A